MASLSYHHSMKAPELLKGNCNLQIQKGVGAIFVAAVAKTLVFSQCYFSSLFFLFNPFIYA